MNLAPIALPQPLLHHKFQIANRRRNGKVASLPKPQRNLVNQMLDDGAGYSDISASLAQLGFHVSPRNISNWYRGGYQDWLQLQARLETTSFQQDSLLDLLRTENSTDLPEVGLQLAVTQLSQILLAKPLCPQPTETQVNLYLRLANSLSRITRQLIAFHQRREDAAYDSDLDNDIASEPEPPVNGNSEKVDSKPDAHDASAGASNPQSQVANRKSRVLMEAHGNLWTSAEAPNNSAAPLATLPPAAGIATISPTHELGHWT